MCGSILKNTGYGQEYLLGYRLRLFRPCLELLTGIRFAAGFQAVQARLLVVFLFLTCGGFLARDVSACEIVNIEEGNNSEVVEHQRKNTDCLNERLGYLENILNQLKINETALNFLKEQIDSASKTVRKAVSGTRTTVYPD